MKSFFAKPWLVLFGLQLVAIAVIFPSFLTGKAYFAYTDIGSDTFTFYAPIVAHMAHALHGDGYTGWSFGIGLGSATALWLADVFNWLHMLGGADNVLPLRIWIYLLKLLLGGAAFLFLLRCYLTRWEAQVVGALAYTFCGYIVINGQWDSEATVFIFLPLILWAITHHLRSGKLVWLPLVIAASLVSGAFFVSLGVFLALTGLAFVLTSDSPKAMVMAWLTRIVPLTALGFLLAAPALLPMVYQYLDSSRVSGGQNLFDKVLEQSLRLNEWPLILAQLGSLFHKDIFGIGSQYRGYWNYLEGPGFYIGVLPLILLTQLWRGSRTDRRALLLGLAATLAYIVLPVFRNAAMGFAVPYFRVSTLWVTLLLLLLACKALDQVLRDGVDGAMLTLGAAVFALLLAWCSLGSLREAIVMAHVGKLALLATLGVLVLLLANRQWLPAKALAPALLGLVLLDVLLIARASYSQGRDIVTPQTNAYQDGTVQALQAIRAADVGVYRVEKTYHSVGLADALMQDYMGVASYAFHSKGVVDFNVAMGQLPPAQPDQAVNYTNWIPDADARFVLNSLLGVKYLISREPVQMPAFRLVNQSGALLIYRNDMALPLGFVQTRQLSQKDFQQLDSFEAKRSQVFKDITIINAVVLDELRPGFGEPFDLRSLLSAPALTLEENYFKPARSLQASGLQVTSFASNRIAGSIKAEANGVLVFSIPFNRGWSLTVDGKPTALLRANFGLLGAPVTAGNHQISLTYQIPGWRLGTALGLAGWLALAGLIWQARRRASPAATITAAKPSTHT